MGRASVLLLAFACGGGSPADTPFELVFAAEADRAVWAVLSVEVFRGSACEGAPLWRDVQVREGESPLRTLPPVLDDGDYCIRAVSRDVSCRRHAFIERTVALPTERLRLVLASVAPVEECAGDRCDGGLCRGESGLQVPRPLLPATGSHVDAEVGFRWTEVDGAARYEVALASCIGALETCELGAIAFESATSRAEETVGSGRFAWRVRACDVEGCTPWSTARVFVAGRSLADLDDDGGDEVLVGMPGADCVASYVSDPAPLCPAPPGSAFGTALAMGDLDGDGVPDWVGGAPFFTGGSLDEGATYVFRGPSYEGTILRSADVTETATFGAALALGDVNGDGVGDLVVGSPPRAVEGVVRAGSVEVFLGPSLSAVLPVAAAPPVDARFGASLAVTDLDADGFAEVVVGSPGDDRVLVYAGVDLAAAPLAWRGGGSFGAAVAALGDVDGDGFGDVAVGAPEAAGGGEVLVFRGGETLDDAAAWTFPNLGMGSSRFGAALAGGRSVGGDAAPDLVVGAPAEGGEGAVFVILGSLVPGEFDEDRGVTAKRLDQEASAGSQLGAALALLDRNGDGVAEVVAGAPGAGRVVVYALGAGLTVDASVLPTDGLVTGGARFGSALAD